MERLTKYESIAGHAHAIPTVDADIAIQKLAAYEDLEEQGLLLRLPCKVGDYAWDLISHHRFEVVSIELHLTGRVMFRCGNKGTDDYASFSLEDIGDTWMLTEPKETDYWHPAKENTEAALEKMNEVKEDEKF